MPPVPEMIELLLPKPKITKNEKIIFDQVASKLYTDYVKI
jgi:hypothetical protein